MKDILIEFNVKKSLKPVWRLIVQYWKNKENWHSLFDTGHTFGIFHSFTRENLIKVYTVRMDSFLVRIYRRNHRQLKCECFSLVFKMLCNIVKFIFVFKAHAVFHFSVETLIYSVTYIKKYLRKCMWREYRSDHCPCWKWVHDFLSSTQAMQIWNSFYFCYKYSYRIVSYYPHTHILMLIITLYMHLLIR